MSRGREKPTDYERSVADDAKADAVGRCGGMPGRVNVEAVREVEREPEPVQVTDFAINRPGVGVKQRCGSYPHGCGGVIEGPDHVCHRGRFAGRRRG